MVLGGISQNDTLSNVDLNAVITYGTYRIASGSSWSTIQNKPNTTLMAGVLRITPGSSTGWRTQEIIDQSPAMYVRQVYVSDPSYNTKWQKVTTTQAE